MTIEVDFKGDKEKFANQLEATYSRVTTNGAAVFNSL